MQPLGKGKSLAKPPNRSLGDPNLKERTSTKNPVPRDITKGNPKDGKKSSKRKTGGSLKEPRSNSPLEGDEDLPSNKNPDPKYKRAGKTV